MTFGSESELKSYLLSKCRNAVVSVQERIYEIIDANLDTYYGEFKPAEYIRTKQLLYSLVMSNVEQSGNGIAAEVYFKDLNYEQGLMPLQHTPEHGRYGWATWSGEKVLETAMHGSHGGYVQGTPIWDKSLADIGNIYDKLKQALIAEGIPIK